MMKSFYRFIKKAIKCCFIKIRNPILSVGRHVAFRRQEKEGINTIPVFIISFNRLTYLKATIESLEKIGICNINIIDNASTYPPLLQYYHEINYRIFYMDKNYGHKVFWENDFFKKYRRRFYIVTDPDLVFVEDCPGDLIPRLFNALKAAPYVRKVGVSLKIDDIPEQAKFYKEVIRWESKYYADKLPFIDAYLAETDTTFALYMPDNLDISENFYSGIRLNYPYQARHIPWYKKENEISDEDRYYAEHQTNGWWTIANATPSAEAMSGGKLDNT